MWNAKLVSINEDYSNNDKIEVNVLFFSESKEFQRSFTFSASSMPDAQFLQDFMIEECKKLIVFETTKENLKSLINVEVLTEEKQTEMTVASESKLTITK